MTATDIRDTAETAAAVTTMPIADINPDPRRRRRLGRIRDLQRSIRDLGLLRPIPVTADGLLLAGERRLRACKNLGWTDIPVTVARDPRHAVELIHAECKEAVIGGPCALPMTATELVAAGVLIEDLLRPELLTNRSRPGSNPGGRRRQSRDLAAEAVGVPVGQYAQIRTIVLASRGFEPVPGGTTTAPIGEKRRTEARNLLDVIDRVYAGGDIPHVSPMGRHMRLTVNAIYTAWRGPGNFDFAPGKPRDDISWNALSEPEPTQRTARTDQRKAVGAAVATLSGLCHGLDSIQTIDPAVSADEAASWNHDLAAALRTIRTLQTKIKEHAHGIA